MARETDSPPEDMAAESVQSFYVADLISDLDFQWQQRYRIHLHEIWILPTRVLLPLYLIKKKMFLLLFQEGMFKQSATSTLDTYFLKI